MVGVPRIKMPSVPPVARPATARLFALTASVPLLGVARRRARENVGQLTIRLAVSSRAHVAPPSSVAY